MQSDSEGAKLAANCDNVRLLTSTYVVTWRRRSMQLDLVTYSPHLFAVKLQLGGFLPINGAYNRYTKHKVSLLILVYGSRTLSLAVGYSCPLFPVWGFLCRGDVNLPLKGDSLPIFSLVQSLGDDSTLKHIIIFIHMVLMKLSPATKRVAKITM